MSLLSYYKYRRHDKDINEMTKKKRITEIISTKKEIIKTILLFLILCFVLNFAYFFFFKEQIPQRSFTASLVAFLLSLFGLPAEANGTFVLMEGASIDIIGECIPRHF